MMPSAWTRALAAVTAGAVWVLGGACKQGQPTAPSTPPDVIAPADGPLRISTERYLLQVSALDLTETFTPWCEPIGVPAAGKFLTTFVWFEQQGDGYIGRTRPPYRSTLEIRFRRTEVSNGVATINGTVTGGAYDEYDRFLGERDLRVTVTPGTSARFTGTVTQQRDSPIVPPPEISGSLEGLIAFSDSTGAVSRCPTANLYFQVAVPGGVHDDPTVPPIVPGFGPGRFVVGAPPIGDR